MTAKMTLDFSNVYNMNWSKSSLAKITPVPECPALHFRLRRSIQLPKQETGVIYTEKESFISTDPSAIVDPELKVHNITGLRVVADASVMPYVISGNTNAPTVKSLVPQVNNF